MAIDKRSGPNREKSFARDAAPYTLKFTAANPVVASTIVQDEGVVATVARSSAGRYLVTLISKFYRIIVTGVNVRKTGNWDAKAFAVVDGAAAANTIIVEVNNIGTGLADPAAIVDLSFRLINSPGS